MVFSELAIAGAWVIEVERHSDERGFFARTWCREEFVARGIAPDCVQASVSFNRYAGTIRGMHFSLPPAREGKLVRCSLGRIHDVMLDLRPRSRSFGDHVAVVLDHVRHNAVYVPPGVAHGFQTLDDESEVYYMMTEAYQPDLAVGVRYSDPFFHIEWPLPVSVISERDRTYPDFDLEAHNRLLDRACMA